MVYTETYKVGVMQVAPIVAFWSVKMVNWLSLYMWGGECKVFALFHPSVQYGLLCRDSLGTVSYKDITVKWADLILCHISKR